MTNTKRENSSDDESVKKASPIPISSSSNAFFRPNKRLRSSRSSRFRNASIRLRRGEHELSVNLNEQEKQGDIGNRCENQNFNSGMGDHYMLMCSDSKSSPPFSFINNSTTFGLLYDNSDIESISSNSSSLFLCQGSHFFDGSTINPLEEACLVLHEASEDLVGQEGSKEEVVIWLLNSPKSKNEFLRESSSTESLQFDNCTMSICSDDDLTSRISDFDKTGSGAWFSSLSKKLGDFEVGSSNISVYSFGEEKNDLLGCDLTSENVSKTADLEDIDADGPLFWPLERKFDWNSNVKWDLICISPRKNGIYKVASSDDLSSPNSIKVNLHKRQKDLKGGPQKRVLCRSKSVVSTELKGKPKSGKGNENKLLRINTMPNSRLSISSTEGFMKIMPLEIKELFGDFSELLEENYFVSNDDISIEKLVGLNEFDGHEGVGGDKLGKDYRLKLDESFDGSSKMSRFSKTKRFGSMRERKRAR